MHDALLTMLLPWLLAAGTATANVLQGSDKGCAPAQTEATNVQQEPAFRGQTRACKRESDVDFAVVELAKTLEHPWAIEPLPNGDLLVTERPGRMRVVSGSGEVGKPLDGMPEVYAAGQGGLLDVALDPDFANNQVIYWSYSEPRRDGRNGTSVARGILLHHANRIKDVKVIFRAQPAYKNSMHYGSRLAFDDEGSLFVTLGERSDKSMQVHSQQPGSHLGTIARINPDGSVRDDNPFVGEENAQPETWTLGHRNVQAAAFDGQGNFWIVEHGPRGGDELNLVKKGNNYGWPLVSYGLEYSGAPIATAKTRRAGYEQPVYYWDPVIAPSGAEFYSGDAFPDWHGDLFIGGLVTRSVVRLELDGGRVAGEEHLLTDRGRRIRDVKQGPDGALYVVTDHDNGELWKIQPPQSEKRDR